MGFKKKVFGFVAAAALTLSMVGVASAAEVGGEVKLDGGACKITATNGGFNFGTWTFDGEKYVNSGTTLSSIDLTIQRAQAKDTCTLSVDTEGLTRQGLSNHPVPVIDSEHFSAAVTQGFSSEILQDLPHTTQVRNGDASLGINLDEVPADYVEGTYKGTFDITISAGQ